MKPEPEKKPTQNARIYDLELAASNVTFLLQRIEDKISRLEIRLNQAEGNTLWRRACRLLTGRRL